MNRLLSLLMAIFLVACPQLCRAEPLGCCAESCERDSRDEHPGEPEPAQPEAVSCICAGAIQDLGSPIELVAGRGEWSPLAFSLPSLLLAVRPSPDAARDGSPPGGPPGGSRRIHLIVRHFRC